MNGSGLLTRVTIVMVVLLAFTLTGSAMRTKMATSLTMPNYSGLLMMSLGTYFTARHTQNKCGFRFIGNYKQSGLTVANVLPLINKNKTDY
jgi:hypothetical protein